MNRYVLTNGRYDDITHYVVTAYDMTDAIDRLTQYLESLGEDKPSEVCVTAIRVFDESATIVRID